MAGPNPTVRASEPSQQFPDVPQTLAEGGYQTRTGQMCDCGVQVLGAALCCWCGGQHPPLSPKLQQLKQEIDRAAVAEPTGGE